MAKTRVESIHHKDKRTNIPTEELRDFVADEELTPRTSTVGRRTSPRKSTFTITSRTGPTASYWVTHCW
jgi:hypothetical protein